MTELRELRDRAAMDLALSKAPVSRPELAWAKTCFVCAKWMTWDRRFIDPATGEFLPEKFLNDGEERFGGYDAMLFWQAYPRIGFDDRNQFDFYRELPALRRASEYLRSKGVKVFICYNPWDVGTRREGKSDGAALREIVEAIGADGVFLDTMRHGDEDLYRHLVQEGRPLGLESEGDMPPEVLNIHALSWMQWPQPPDMLGLLRNHWLSPGHMQHVIRRWHRSHRHEMMLAWLNGVGMLVWEHVFGSWNGWSAENAAMLKGMQGFWRSHREFFEKGEFRPFVPLATNGILASEWRLGKERIWCLANPARVALRVRNPLALESARLIGREIEIPPRSVAAVSSRLRGEARQSHYPPMLVVPAILRREPPAAKSASVPFGMAEVDFPGGVVTARYRHRECGDYRYANFEDPGSPGLHQAMTVSAQLPAKRFAVDVEEVSNEQFREFLEATDYWPRHAERFLRHWTNMDDARTLPAAMAHQPVTFVDLDDARAYAKWKGKRLPTEWEWQLAAQSGKISRGSPLVWNLTESEHTDGITDFFFLKGGCDKATVGSHWYADGGPQEPDFIAKFIRINPGLDRCATVGFRCARDLQ